MSTFRQNIIAQNIKSALKENKVNQSELANVLGKSRAYVSNIVKGRYTPRMNELFKISDFLNKPLRTFFGEENPELTTYAEKADKWDQVVNLFSNQFQAGPHEYCISIPHFNFTDLYKKKIKVADTLLSHIANYIYITRYLIKKHLKYHKPMDKLFSIRLTDEFPSFGMTKDDIGIFEPVYDNLIEEEGKIYLVLYKSNYGLKRIFKQSNKYYFEPLNSAPEIDRIKPDDKDLSIIGRLLFDIHIRFY